MTPFRLKFTTPTKTIYLTKRAPTRELADMLGRVHAAKCGRYGMVFVGSEEV